MKRKSTTLPINRVRLERLAFPANIFVVPVLSLVLLFLPAQILSQSFTDVTSSAGLSSINNTYGAGWGDYNNDGYPDLYVSGANALYKNDGDGTFSAGPSLTGAGGAAHWGDYDNDGYLDFLSSSGIIVSLNNSGISFTQQNNATIGITFVNNIKGVQWLDYDNDGDLDFFGNNGTSNGNRIYSNDGDGTFTTLTPTGINSVAGNGEVTGVADYDGDGDTDIIFRISSTVRILKNNGDNTFSLAYSFTVTDDGGGYNGMAWGDFDNDGDLDLYMGGNGAVNELQRNDGSDTFTNITSSAGVAGSNDNTKGVAWGDYDLDGDLDLYVGHSDNNNQLFRNNGDNTFTDVASTYGLDDASATYSTVWADYDLDGDLDLFVGNSSSVSKLFRNDIVSSPTAHLKVKATGKGASNAPKDGTGAVVELWNSTATTRHAVRELFGGKGNESHSPRYAHFGLASGWGGGSGTYTVKVKYTSGLTETLSNVTPTSSSITIGSTTLSNTVHIAEHAPMISSAAYKDTDSDGTVDRIDVTYDESISTSTFESGDWSFPTNPHSLTVSSGSISGTDVQITVTGAPAGNTALSATTVKYTDQGTSGNIKDSDNDAAATSLVVTVSDEASPAVTL